jgi:hypothetical protein
MSGQLSPVTIWGRSVAKRAGHANTGRQSGWRRGRFPYFSAKSSANQRAAARFGQAALTCLSGAILADVPSRPSSARFQWMTNPHIQKRLALEVNRWHTACIKPDSKAIPANFDGSGASRSPTQGRVGANVGRTSLGERKGLAWNRSARITVRMAASPSARPHPLDETSGG